MNGVTIEVPEAAIIEQAKKYWEEQDWPNVKSIEATITPTFWLTLRDDQGRSLGGIQGKFNIVTAHTVQVQP